MIGAPRIQNMVSRRTPEGRIEEQIAYYRLRAPEYDEWFFRRGRYDRGPEDTRRWFAEVDQVRDALARCQPHGRILELACGPGIWTEQLLPYAAHLHAVDASPEVLELNRARVGWAEVEYQVADLFEWKPHERFDFVFFGFWISHVPPDRFAAFWELVRSCLSPGARAFFVDNRFPKRAASDTLHIDREQNTARRSLENGQEFEIVKVYYTPQQLGRELASLGFDCDVHVTENFFLYGDACPYEWAARA